MKVLVTGGAGFIGQNLVRHLIATPGVEEVRVLDNLSSGAGATASRLPAAAQFIRGSILDGNTLDRAVRGVDSVVHLAAMVSVPLSMRLPEETHAINATGTLKVLEAAKRHRVEQVVLASSAAVYGRSASTEENSPTHPISPYGASKLAAEAYAMAYGEMTDLKVTILRLFNVYGPGQDGNVQQGPVIARFAHQAANGLPLLVEGSGTQTREFVHVFTVCEVIRRAITANCWWSVPVNVAFGQRHSINHVVEMLEQITGRPLEVVRGVTRPGDIRHSGASGHLLRTMSAFDHVEPIDLRRGLENLLKHMVDA